MTRSGLPRAAAGAAAAVLLRHGLTARPPGGARRWSRTNHRGATVTLLPGPVLALAAGASSGGLPALVAGTAAGAVGCYDDVVGQRPEQRGSKGVRGHAIALARGQVTAGALKVVGLGLTGLVAARLGGRRGADVLLDGALVAGAANLVNLFDLRPGRALKVGVLGALAVGRSGPAAACLVLLPDDLAERAMLGDAGANGLGAVLGVALTERLPGRGARTAALAALVGLTAASEVVSFSAVIDRVPALRALDRLGRLP